MGQFMKKHSENVKNSNELHNADAFKVGDRFEVVDSQQEQTVSNVDDYRSRFTVVDKDNVIDADLYETIKAMLKYKRQFDIEYELLNKYSFVIKKEMRDVNYFGSPANFIRLIIKHIQEGN